MSANLVGSGNSISVGSGSTVNANGSSGNVTATGNMISASDGTSFTLNGGTENTVNANWSSLTVSNAGLTLAGTGNAANAYYSILSLTAGSSLTLTGNSNTINGGAGDAITIASGSGNIINATGDAAGGLTADGQATGITVGAGVSATIVGAGNTIYVRNGSVVMASGDTIVGSAGASFTVIGTGNTVECSGPTSNVTVSGPDNSISYYVDPVILNLAGGQVETTALATSTAYFDVRDNGQAVHTGWLAAGEGVLVYEPTGSETFANEANLVSNFEQLKALNLNGDGKVDAGNAAWGGLKVWVDPTGSANFQAGQLKTLSELGIASVNLNVTKVNAGNNGNTILEDSSFTRTDGTTGAIASANLQYAPGAVQSAPGTQASLAATSSDTAAITSSTLLLSRQAFIGSATAGFVASFAGFAVSDSQAGASVGGR